MSWEYSENILVQNSTGNLLQGDLGWDVHFAYNKEVLGESGTFGRKSYKDIVLTRYLRAALFDNNDWLTEDQCENAIKTLLSYSSTSTLMQINREKYSMLRDGIPIKVSKPNGEQEDRRVRVFNFAEPDKNHFLAVKEMKIHGDLYRRRTDIVGFVNGIPLLFIELKKQNVDVQDAYTCNYRDYQDTIPHLFHFNAFLVLSNGIESKVGTLGSKFEFFNEWKRLHEDEAGSVDLETMLRGICSKENFMDLFENFMLFDTSNGETNKIMARNHQFLGVNEAVESYKNRKLNNGKLGVFWHTQGSGKSYSMVFLAQKIKRKFTGSPTFVILTDRDELNKQISDTFEACGCLGTTKAEQFIASSGDDLILKLKGNPSYIFSLIHKFNRTDLSPIIPEHDIIILSDEAHRTQNGIFADNMVALLPTASRIGFTGTPLFAYDNITERTFGGYVSVYDFKRAVDDGATVPLYYENRADLLDIENPEINDRLIEAIEQSDLDVNQQAKLEQELAKDIHVLTSKKRLDTIAKDFVEHYSELWTTGKAMFVCINKVTAVRMYHLVQDYWIEKIKEIESTLIGAAQQEYMEISRKLEWLKATEMAVIISQEQNEIATFEKWGLDIKPHRTKMEKREMDKEFKDPNNSFRIVFVCAMWLTGFDVKSLSTIYIDKPLKAHTLMQTIARANRVYEGKSNGLIVDYVGVVKALRKALADYTKTVGGTGGNDPAPDKTELLARIVALINEIDVYMNQNGFDLTSLVKAKDFEKLALVQAGANAMCKSEEIKKRFEVMARELFKLFKYVEKHEVTDLQRACKNAISAVYDQMQEKRKHSDNTDLMIQLHDIVSEYINVLDPAIRVKEDGVNYLAESRRFDISHIDFDRLQQEFARVKNKNLLMKDLQSLIDDRLDNMMKRNPSRIDYYERYQTIIQEFNAEQDKAAIEKTFIDLTNFVNDLDDEERRYVREGFDNDEELAMYDLLMKESLTPAEIKKVKALAKALLEQIKETISELDHWTEKEETQAAVDVVIRNTLWSELPESYDDTLVNEYRQRIYEFVYSTYPAA
ncbi:type I restriction endonuclease subunit R [Dehalococcoides mccartyi]|uniref:Type I restriction enzyme endonuclease subunit n=1 Tax=Dehalococcoides mccartyi TaxID=61435 RepID=A0AB38ZBG4_9CHLR|nr:type I restriction endonuclease subunit R [Dehalococcoides mccartyi]WRO07933.1 type I restriction endonuclease subunit R [Dehalococcoides mccartyi]